MKENNCSNTSGALSGNNEVSKVVKDGQFYEETCQIVRESVQVLLEMVNESNVNFK